MSEIESKRRVTQDKPRGVTVARRESPIPFYSQSGALDPTDIKSIQCIVGYVEDRGKWGLVDRSGPLAHAVFTEAD